MIRSSKSYKKDPTEWEQSTNIEGKIIVEKLSIKDNAVVYKVVGFVCICLGEGECLMYKQKRQKKHPKRLELLLQTFIFFMLTVLEQS